jgi:hypothetical protein
MSSPICPYCQIESKKITGKEIYAHRPDLYSKIFYQCQKCYAHVGCHPNTDKPLGDLACKKKRVARMLAHKAFDPIWKSGKEDRKDAYAWLCQEMGLSKSKCHIGMMNEEQCKRVVDICKKHA